MSLSCCFIPEKIGNYAASPRQTRQKIFSLLLESDWQRERLSYLDFPSPPSVRSTTLCLESMRAVTMHSWTHFVYKFVQDNSTFYLWQFWVSIVWAQKFSKCIYKLISQMMGNKWFHFLSFLEEQLTSRPDALSCRPEGEASCNWDFRQKQKEWTSNYGHQVVWPRTEWAGWPFCWPHTFVTIATWST